MQSRLEDLLATIFVANPPSLEEEKDQLKEQIFAVRRQISQMENMFNYAQNDALTETSIYQLKALNGYLDYLLKKMRGKAVDDLVFSPQEKQLERIGGPMG